MKNKLWQAVYSCYRELDADGGGQLTAERLIALRKRLRVKLDILRSELAKQLNEREIFYVLFPIVVYLDEVVQKRILPGERIEWIRLQKELFDIDTGGNRFYEVIDDLLAKPDTYPFVFEVFYFCLSDGFVGRYEGNLVELNAYKDKLRKRIQVSEIPTYSEQAVDMGALEHESFPIWSYAIAILVLVGIYTGLWIFASYELLIPAAGQ